MRCECGREVYNVPCPACKRGKQFAERMRMIQRIRALEARLEACEKDRDRLRQVNKILGQTLKPKLKAQR